MVSLSFSSFMFVMLLFIFLTIKDTIVHTDDQAKQIVHEAEIDNIRDLRSHLSVKKEVLDGVPAAAEFSNGKMGGRKMMIEIQKDMKEVKKADSSGAASASIHSVGNIKYHKGEGKLREMSGISSKSHSMKANRGSFVALNADYHMARPHPPKNKEVLDGVPAAAEFSIGKMEGRKMMIERKKDMMEVKKTESSGNYDRHLGHDSRKSVHHQDNERDSMNLASTHNSKNDDQSDDNGSFENLGSENFQDDATEFFTMNKDYVGRPRRKPGHKVFS
ncbi:uncharacterized protein [Solanum tuberosum]|uniref:uncharacterized protein n=1 Tax=Solanum tuberosum TaxID=4113 RepID=UPI00073A2CB0|nr:PREDICTED: uncharacterized protein LOC107060152 [Solanum tuberosum]KAH0703445.1 hypothetical protein KY285_017723 [Solanum tuberosum]